MRDLKKNKAVVNFLTKQVIIMDKKQTNRQVLALLLGEIVVAVLTSVGAFVISLFTEYVFDLSVITGSVLGALVVVINFAFLTISVNRAVDSYLEARGSSEMTEEEAERFTNENSMVIQNKIKISFIIRTVTMLAALVLAFITGWFNPLSTAIPMLMFRPLIYICETLKGKTEK